MRASTKKAILLCEAGNKTRHEEWERRGPEMANQAPPIRRAVCMKGLGGVGPALHVSDIKDPWYKRLVK